MRSRRGRLAALVVLATATAVVGTPVAALAAGRPDLVVSAASLAATSVARGSLVSVTSTTSNTGKATSKASSTRFYLGSGSTHQSADPVLGSRAVAALRPGKSSTGATKLRVPAGTALASYTVFACADATRKVGETSERDNCRSAGSLSVVDPVSSDQLIDDDASLSADTKVLYKVYAQFGDPHLPPEYRGIDNTHGAEDTALQDAAQAWPTLSQTVKDELDPYFLAPFDEGSWYEAARYPRATATLRKTDPPPPEGDEPLQNLCLVATVDTAHWSRVVGEGGKVDVWYPKGDDALAKKAAQVRDDIDKVLWTRLTEVFNAPLQDDGSTEKCRGGTDAIDIVLGDTVLLDYDKDPKTANPRGYAQRWEFNDCHDPTPGYLVLDANEKGLALDGVLFHEMTHLSHFGYSWSAGCDDTQWMTEMTANWMEDYLFGKKFQPEQDYAPPFEKHPEWSINDVREYREYGAYLFPFYLDHLAGPTVMTDMWKDVEHTDSFHAMEEGLEAHQGSFENLWADFTLLAWNQGPIKDFQTWDAFKQHPATDPCCTGTGTKLGSGNTIDLPTDLPRLSAKYYDFKFTKDLGGIQFTNPLAGQANDGARVRAMEKMSNGTWKQFTFGNFKSYADNWSLLPEKDFCRTVKGQDVSELVIIISNASIDKDFTVTGQPRLRTTNGCGYSGSISGTSDYSAYGYTQHLTFSGDVDLSAERSSDPYYLADGGTITVSGTGSNDSGCTFTFPSQQIPAADIVFSLSFDGQGSYEIGNAYLPEIQGTRDCGDGPEGASSFSVPVDAQDQSGNAGDSTISGSSTTTQHGDDDVTTTTDWSWDLSRTAQ